MDKKDIKAAVEALVSMRQAQQVISVPLGNAPSDHLLFKPGTTNAQLAEMAAVCHNQDLQIPERVTHLINVTLDNAGYKENVQYSEQQMQDFSNNVAQALQSFLSNYSDVINILAV